MDVCKIRSKTGLNQKRFWAPLGVTQSGGSRYESGRRLPGPLAILIEIAYGTDRAREKAIARVRGGR